MTPEKGDQYKPLEDEEMPETEKSEEKINSDKLTVEDMVNKWVLTKCVFKILRS